MSTPLTPYQRETYERIVASSEAVLARWSPSNPMRASVERQAEEARAKLAPSHPA